MKGYPEMCIIVYINLFLNSEGFKIGRKALKPFKDVEKKIYYTLKFITTGNTIGFHKTSL